MKGLLILIIMILSMLVFIADYQKHATKKNLNEVAKTIQKGVY